MSFLEKCKAVGVRMDAVVYPGEGHSFFGLKRSLDRFYDTTIEMDKFLGSLGWISGSPTLTKEEVKAFATEAAENSQKKKTSKRRAIPRRPTVTDFTLVQLSQAEQRP